MHHNFVNKLLSRATTTAMMPRNNVYKAILLSAPPLTKVNYLSYPSHGGYFFQFCLLHSIAGKHHFKRRQIVIQNVNRMSLFFYKTSAASSLPRIPHYFYSTPACRTVSHSLLDWLKLFLQALS
jgi:hypothetical protein